MKRWTCALCHQSDEPHRRRDICDNCDDGLVARGLAWCTLGKHRVGIETMTKGACKACKARRARARYVLGQSANRAKAWRAQNDEKRRAYNARPDVIARRREQTKASYQRNHDKRLATAQRRRESNRHIYVERMRAYRIAHPGYTALASRRQRDRAKLKILQSWKRAA